MAVSLAVFWVRSYDTEKDWSYVASHFGVDQLYMVGGEWASAPFRDAITVADASELPTDPLVLLAPLTGKNYQGDVSLADFTHPTDCVYLLGADNANLEEAHFNGRVPDHQVYIPTDTNDQMYSYVAAAVTMWDRRCKGG